LNVNVDDRIDWIRFYSERLPTQPKPAGEHKYNACCPFHQEKNPSFWFNTKNGMWKCETGCGSGNATTFLSRIENIDTGAAWEKLCKLAGVDKQEKPDPKLPLTLEMYAASKKLPLDFLRQLGLNEKQSTDYVPGHVTIPYYDSDGACVAVRQRRNPNNKQRFAWNKGGTPIVYGVWLDINKTARAVILVEGESDAQSCWLHGLPALGVPGATNFQASWTRRYIGEKDVFIHVEPDNGGQTFRQKVAQGLHDSGYTGTVRTFSVKDIDSGCKDPSDLHIKYGDQFRAMIDPALKAAPALDLAAECMKIHEAKQQPEPEGKTIKKLNVYHAADLYGKTIERPPVIVQGMIPAGLTVLAGAPKRGKSWLALMLALCVAAGEPFLGAETTQGDVLYMDLESRQYRVKDRLGKLIVGRAPESLYITHESDRLEAGLVEQLGMWCEDVEHPVLIIIDTMGRVKGGARRGENAYEGDTRILGDLQKFALQRNLAVVCIHHLKKDPGGNVDWFERISGSMGITGACDSVLGLVGKRGEETSVLNISSRDFENAELIIGFKDGRWSLKSTNSEAWQEEQEYTNSPYVRAVVGMAHRYHRWTGSPTEFLEELASFGADTDLVRPEKITAEVLKYRDRLHNQEGVLFQRGKRSKGKRFVTVQEVQTDGF
jgi:hypothetical protein